MLLHQEARLPGLTVSLLGQRYQPTIMLMIMSTKALMGAVITCSAAAATQWNAKVGCLLVGVQRR
jgi:hypothetical protein